MRAALEKHWPEYLMEAALLGLFMVSAALFGTLLEHPGSPLRRAIDDPLLRRGLMGLAMGGTAIALVHSAFGKQSGAHMNPAVTLTFLRLGKIRRHDALFYVAAQFAGAVIGLWAAALVLGDRLADPRVNYVATLPGRFGPLYAFAAEAFIAFVLMATILALSASARFGRYTASCAGVLVAIYITFEAPISGMSMNPARTLGSALPADAWNALWIYFTAPPLGMLLAAEVDRRVRRVPAARCAKMHHDNPTRCIFCGARMTPSLT